MPCNMDVVLATNNRGKLHEFQALVPADVGVHSAAELGLSLPDETGRTFAENALLKARAAARQSGLIALADDSGLEVDVLDGAPGVRSARFAGLHGDDPANNALLLRLLADVPSERRTARFRSVVAIVTPQGQEYQFEGILEGTITTSPRGTGGFGYDPLFQPDGSPKTLAELSLEQKNAISHRGRAFRAAAERLTALLRRPL